MSQNTNYQEPVMPEFPQELVIEILLSSRVKSILRFRRVSKSICAIIDSQYFTYTHLNRSSKNKNHRKLLLRELSPNRKQFMGFHICDINGDGSDTKIKFGISPKLTLIPYSYCNGLLLLPAGILNLSVWNPTTKRSRNIPRCPVQKQIYPGLRMRLGLGYDSTADDYKVVQIYHVASSKCQAWIFELKTNLWRRVEYFPYIKHYSSSMFAYLANGALHWLYDRERQYPSIRQSSQEQHIVAFDVAKEMFSHVTQPIYSTEGYVTGLHVLDERLCVSFSSGSVPNKAVLYVRQKNGAEFKWSTLYSVTADQLPSFLEIKSFSSVRVLGYLKGGDKIMLHFGHNFMVSYDLKEKCFEYIIREYIFDNPIIFTESLVSVDTTKLEDLLKKTRAKRSYSSIV